MTLWGCPRRMAVMGVAAAFTPAPWVSDFWSHLSRHQGWAVLFAQQDFLRRFRAVAPADWEEGLPGRAAALHLPEPEGALILTTAFPTGSGQVAARRAPMGEIRQWLRRHANSLVAMAGYFTDCNVALRDQDRFDLQAVAHPWRRRSGGGDPLEGHAGGTRILARAAVAGARTLSSQWQLADRPCIHDPIIMLTVSLVRRTLLDHRWAVRSRTTTTKTKAK